MAKSKLTAASLRRPPTRLPKRKPGKPYWAPVSYPRLQLGDPSKECLAALHPFAAPEDPDAITLAVMAKARPEAFACLSGILSLGWDITLWDNATSHRVLHRFLRRHPWSVPDGGVLFLSQRAALLSYGVVGLDPNDFAKQPPPRRTRRPKRAPTTFERTHPIPLWREVVHELAHIVLQEHRGAGGIPSDEVPTDEAVVEALAVKITVAVWGWNSPQVKGLYNLLRYETGSFRRVWSMTPNPGPGLVLAMRRGYRCALVGEWSGGKHT